MRFIAFLFFWLIFFPVFSQSQFNLIQNPHSRNHQVLNGNWHYVVDPYDTGYRNHRNWQPFDQKDANFTSLQKSENR